MFDISIYKYAKYSTCIGGGYFMPHYQVVTRFSELIPIVQYRYNTRHSEMAGDTVCGYMTN